MPFKRTGNKMFHRLTIYGNIRGKVDINILSGKLEVSYKLSKTHLLSVCLIVVEINE